MTKRTTPNPLVAGLLGAAMAVGCGGDDATETTPTETTASAGAEQGYAERGRAEQTRMAAPVTRPADYPEPAPVSEHVRDVNVYLMAESPVGIVPSEHAEEFPIYVYIENDSDRALLLDDLLARIIVSERGETVCEEPEFGSIRPLEDVDPVIPPHSARRFVTSLPCGLEETGDYDIVAEVLFAGESEDVGVPAPTDPHRAASLRLDVSDLEPVYARVRPSLAEVPPIDPDRLASVPIDVDE